MIEGRGIFIKMFIWFWLVMTVVVSVIIALDRLTESFGPGTPMARALEASLTRYGQIAVEQLEKGDRPGMIQTLQSLNSFLTIAPYLFDGNLMEMQDKVAPADVMELAAKARQTGRPAFSFSPVVAAAALPISRDRTHEYIIAGAIARAGHEPFRDNILFFLPRLGVALVISCLACYLLARYMTTPIIRLKNAARRLASGDLLVRVSPAAGKRWDEIGELARDFDLMAERIQLLLISQQRLMGDISHELRSPLARLNVALELAKRQSASEAGKFLDRIGWEAQRLNEMIGELLTLTRLESGITPTNKEPVDLGQLLQDIAEDAHFEAGARERMVRLVENDGCVVAGARDLLYGAIENVVRNAAWHTAEGTEVEIRLQYSTDKRSAVISVRDHGPGVPEETLVDLFRPFYRVGDARERQAGGTGLGLAITERAVRLHGGEIKASNSPQGGLLVQIILGPLLDGGT